MKRILLVTVLQLLLSSIVHLPLFAQRPTEGLTGRYTFTGNANDESGKRNHGIVNGATLTTGYDGSDNGAYAFNGISSSITLPDTSSVTATGGTWSFRFQAKNSSSTTSRVIMSKGISTGNYIIVHYFFGSIRVEISTKGMTGGVVRTIVCPKRIYTDEYYNITLTFQKGVGGTIYMDGEYQNTFTESVDFIPKTNNINVGGPFSTKSTLKGEIDEVHIYSRALAALEVKNLYPGIVPNEVEYQSLVDFYNNTGGSNWTNNSGWLVGNTIEDISKWEGITVKDGDVSSLTLDEKNLIGYIPNSFGNLTQLRRVVLYHTRISSLPPTLGNIPTLISLAIYRSEIRTIPIELTLSKNLQYLVLSGCMITDVPRFPYLLGLDLSYNLITQVPSFIGNNTIQYYDLSGNRISELPRGIENDSTIEDLRVTDNFLVFNDFAPFFKNSVTSARWEGKLSLSPQKKQNLNFNRALLTLSVGLGGADSQYEWRKNDIIIPEAKDSTLILTHEQYRESAEYKCTITNPLIPDLTIESNPLRIMYEGLVPDSVEYAALVDFYNSTGGDKWSYNTGWLQGKTNLDFINWSGLNVENGDVTGISFMFVKPTGSIPPSFGNLTQLKNISIMESEITSIPFSVGKLVNLQYMNINSSKITELPEEIGNLKNLEALNLNNNLITALPSTIGGMEKLKNLNFYASKLTSIPSTIGNLTQLESFDFSYNLLTELPSSIGELTNIASISFNGNLIETLPDVFQGLTKLHWLNGEQNKLKEIPPSLFAAPLHQIFLKDNLIQSIPTTLANSTNIITIDLDNNKLTEIPEFIGTLPELTLLHISDNLLTTLPGSIANLNKLGHFTAAGNQLTEIPSYFGGMPAIYWLNFSNNKIKTIPDLSKLLKLWGFFISGNEVTEIPSYFSSFTDLYYLTLENNRLDFEDIKRVLQYGSVTYSPQKHVGLGFDKVALKFSLAVGGDNNVYKWLADSVLIEEAINSTLSITSEEYNNNSIYQCIITNSSVPELTLYSVRVQPRESSSTETFPIVLNLNSIENKFNYNLSGTINGSYSAGQEQTLSIPIANNDTAKVMMTFSSTDQEPFSILFAVNDGGKIISVDYVSGMSSTTFDSSYFRVENGNKLILLTPSRTVKTSTASISLSGGRLLTPDGDGVNDKFMVKGLEYIQNFTLQIFDQNDIKVFETTDKSNMWDGIDNNSGIRVQPGLFSYRVVTDEKEIRGEFLVDYSL